MAKKTKTNDKEKVKELTSDLKRIQAEFENYLKRTEREHIEFKQRVEADLIKSLLPVLDNFELALQNQTSPHEFLKGVELIYAQFFQTLEDKSLKLIDAEGKIFDPYIHEALLTEKSKEKENTILEVLQKGYTYNDKVIRHAKVKVAKGGIRK